MIAVETPYGEGEIEVVDPDVAHLLDIVRQLEMYDEPTIGRAATLLRRAVGEMVATNYTDEWERLRMSLKHGVVPPCDSCHGVEGHKMSCPVVDKRLWVEVSDDE